MAKKSVKKSVEVTNSEEVVQNDVKNQIMALSVEDLSKYATKSAAIRGIADQFGHDHESNNLTGAIASRLNIRYQHARNVLTQPLKRVVSETPSDDKNVVDLTEVEAQD